MRSFFLVFMLCSTSFALSKSASAAPPLDGADTVSISVSDLKLFWHAYDDWASGNDQRADKLAEVLQREYLDQASQGVKDFIPSRIVSANHLANVILADRAYYETVRQNAERIEAFIPEIHKNLEALKKLYPEASFPTVYFVIGARNTAGTASDHGLILGAEMYGDGEGYLRQLSDLVPVVIHELIHFLQRDDHSKEDLFSSVMREGAADFVAELVVGRHADESVKAYGDSHEQELWERLQRDIRAGGKTGNWMYVYKPTNGEPADLGYYMGYKICQSYYQIAKDKTAAIKAIIEMRDGHKILAMSDYERRFNIQPVEPQQTQER
jgi:uncharacterized protein YjaZ